MEYHVETAKAYESGRRGSLLIVIPKAVRRMLEIEKGTRFNVKVDLSRDRIIYEPTKSIDQGKEDRLVDDRNEEG